MKYPLFTGVCTALVTPFLGEQVNFPMMEQLLRRQIDAGVRAVVICGTTGEAPTIPEDDKLEMFRRAKAYVGNDCLIIAGTGSNCTSHTAALSLAAEEAGADGLLIVSPFYNKPTPEGIIAHYLTVAHTVSIPIIMYNVPSRTGSDIPVSVCQRLSPLPNIAGVKEAGGDITKITRMCRCCENFSVWSGSDDQIVPAISVGAAGVISVLSNVLPVQTRLMAEAALTGDLTTATAMQQELQPLVELLFCEPNPIPVKAAMRYLGFDCGPCRLPLTELSNENKRRLGELLG